MAKSFPASTVEAFLADIKSGMTIKNAAAKNAVSVATGNNWVSKEKRKSDPKPVSISPNVELAVKQLIQAIKADIKNSL